MHHVAKYNRVEILHHIVKAGASVDVEDEDCYTPLHVACYEGNHEIAELLIRIAKDPDYVNRVTKCNESALDFAIENCHRETFKVLLSSGAILDKTCRNEKLTPLHLAAMSGETYITDVILKNKPSLINSLTEEGRSPLHKAALFDQVAVANKLISRFSVFFTKNFSVLMFALNLSIGVSTLIWKTINLSLHFMLLVKRVVKRSQLCCLKMGLI